MKTFHERIIEARAGKSPRPVPQTLTELQEMANTDLAMARPFLPGRKQCEEIGLKVDFGRLKLINESERRSRKGF